jgi:glycosyltransferase involved in cell wall biosynthesis
MIRKIIHVTTVPMTLEFFFRGQIKYIGERGFCVEAVSSPGEELDRVARRDHIPVHAIPMSRSISPLGDLGALFKLWALFRRTRPQIVHASTGKAGPLGILAATLARVPVKVYTLRGVMMDRGSGVTRDLFKLMERMTCHFADRVLAVSNSVADLMVREKICPPEKIRVLAHGSSNGVDALGRFNPDNILPHEAAQLKSRLGIPEDAHVIGYVGRIVTGKGINEMVAAWERIRTVVPKAYLIVVGPVEPQDPVPKHVLDALVADPRVVMVDYAPNEEMPYYYDLMDAVAFPTYSEGFPNVPLEAAAMRVPVVATRATGCVDAVADGETGTLVPIRDDHALEKALLKYLTDQQLRRAHGTAARERVLREYRPELIWEALYEEYMNLLRARTGNS